MPNTVQLTQNGQPVFPAPDVTPALYTEVSIEEWPEYVQPTGAQDAYNSGDRVSFQGRHYESLIDGNVWSPADYPQGWQLIS